MGYFCKFLKSALFFHGFVWVVYLHVCATHFDVSEVAAILNI